MSLPVMSLGDRFCMSKKGRTGEGERVHPKGKNSMAMSWLGCRMAVVDVCMNGLAPYHCSFKTALYLMNEGERKVLSLA